MRVKNSISLLVKGNNLNIESTNAATSRADLELYIAEPYKMNMSAAVSPLQS